MGKGLSCPWQTKGDRILAWSAAQAVFLVLETGALFVGKREGGGGSEEKKIERLGLLNFLLSGAHGEDLTMV